MRQVIFLLAVFIARTASAQAPGAVRIPDPQAPSLADTKNWPECDEYKSKSPCRVTLNLSPVPDTTTNKDGGPLMPRAHWDVQVEPFIHLTSEPPAKAVVLLEHSSPFLACTVAATPTNPTRDQSANIGSLLTAVAQIGAPAGPLVGPNFLAESERRSSRELQEITQAVHELREAVFGFYDSFTAAVQRDWKFSFDTPQDAAAAVSDLKTMAVSALTKPVPDLLRIAEEAQTLNRRVDAYRSRATPDERPIIDQDQAILDRIRVEVAIAKDGTNDLEDERKLVRKVYHYLLTLTDPSAYTEQVLPLRYFAQKTVTETVSCKDAITKDAAFDNIVFTAYYEGLPKVEVSAGALASLLGGRQTGTATGPYSPSDAAACNATPPPPTGV